MGQSSHSTVASAGRGRGAREADRFWPNTVMTRAPRKDDLWKAGTLFDYDSRLHVGVHLARDRKCARLRKGDNIVLAVMLQPLVAGHTVRAHDRHIVREGVGVREADGVTGIDGDGAWDEFEALLVHDRLGGLRRRRPTAQADSNPDRAGEMS